MIRANGGGDAGLLIGKDVGLVVMVGIAGSVVAE
jgi:hypothetical protein